MNLKELKHLHTFLLPSNVVISKRPSDISHTDSRNISEGCGLETGGGKRTLLTFQVFKESLIL